MVVLLGRWPRSSPPGPTRAARPPSPLACAGGPRCVLTHTAPSTGDGILVMGRGGISAQGPHAALAPRALAQQRLDLPQQPWQVHWLRVIVVAAGLERLFLVAAHRMGRERDHGDLLRLGRGLELASCLP